jgi:putative Holliday junction resolvase
VTGARPKGALLGVDFGTVRVGIAVSDPDRIVASPLETYSRRSADIDADHFRRIAKDYGAVEIVIGLPLHADGRESSKSLEARAYGSWLASATALPVVYWDERFTTALAEDALLEANLTSRKRRARRDRVAAQMMLQNYIDAGCPPGGTSIDTLGPDR